MGDRSADSSEGPDWDPWAPAVGFIVRAVRQLLAELGVTVEETEVRQSLEMPGEVPADVSLALHRFAKAAHADPPGLAHTLAERFPASGHIARVSASGAYLNVRADPEDLTSRTLALVLERWEAYGHQAASGSRVCVEHTSANTTGPFHVGRVRNAVIGDTLSRVLRAAGSEVTTQYYVDDLGRQAAMITWIWGRPAESWPAEIRANVGGAAATRADGEKPDRFFGRPYPYVSAYLKTHPDEAQEVMDLAQRLEEGGSPPPLHRELAEKILGGMVASLKRIGIGFDEFVWESGFVRDGSVGHVIERLRTAPHAVREENGAWAIDASEYGLPKTSARIIVTRANGTSLYPTRDLAYHLEKFRRFPRVIDVLGTDHQLHARSLTALLKEIGESRVPEFVFYQYITLPDGGRMSTRQGTAVYLDDLLDEAVQRARSEVLARREDLTSAEVDAIAEKVAAAAVRYHIVRIAPEKTVAFRWEEALSFEGRSAPFLQYSHARASSILRKAERESAPYAFHPEELATDAELDLVRAIARLPGTVDYVARTSHVQALATYAHGLAEQFNRFYQSIRVLHAGKERESRIALVAAARRTLGNTLDLLGVEALDRM